ncbi:hypothetical protein SCHPADRAFT_839614 [Schizopora paradoxa]|uniref:DUF6830 domain-containing protein n=1 Tax=Schizopora paradoxa TaxID=27342 RepID=A0A0H2R1R1_9AGAM|nr:hypothetical protein SCHPADRAFT_839614 [Schizopora paradoxa]
MQQRRGWSQPTVRFAADVEELGKPSGPSSHVRPNATTSTSRSPSFEPPDNPLDNPPVTDTPDAPNSGSIPGTRPTGDVGPFVYHPTAGQCYGYGPNILANVWLTDRFREERKENIYYPFSCEEDLEVAFWLVEQGLSISQIDKFMKLKFIKSHPLSFTSAAQLIDRIEMLPKPPSWKCREITVKGGKTTKPISFFYRDGLECFLYLFGNPIFNGYMELRPYKHFEDEFQKGETLGLVMLASDEAQLTNHYGDKNSHGVYLSCGNIKKELRGIASAKCWVKVAEIPVVTFVEKGLQKFLTNILIHQCLDIVTDNLKLRSHDPIYAPDPEGCIRFVRPFLCAHLGDNPEQQCLACVPENSSAVSIANFHDLGKATACRPRTAEYTLDRISKLRDVLGDNINDLPLLKSTASDMYLNGVLEPYWRDWKFADPSIFITPDALHQWHIFFVDHPMKWARHFLDDKEMDRRISVLQRRIGFRTFPTGFTRFTQHTGRENRDLQRSFIGIIAGHPKITDNIMKAFRGLMDYIYIAQYDSQSTETLRLLRESLKKFHRNKGYISRTGIRDGTRTKGKFNIRKLETFHQTPRIIREIGSAPQFSTDYTERFHIDFAKDLYKMTNRKEWEGQMCRILDRFDKIALFSMALDWKLSAAASDSELSNGGSSGLKRFHARITHLGKYLPKPEKDSFTEVLKPTSTRVIAKSATTAFALTARISFRKKTIAEVSGIYRLPALLDTILSFYNCEVDHQLAFDTIDCWDRVRVQLHLHHDETAIADPYKVAAIPPSDLLPFGLCNFVLVVDRRGLQYRGIQCNGNSHYVAQLRLIFRPFTQHKGRNAAAQRPILAYVEPLKPAPKTISLQSDGSYDHVPDDNIEMFRLVRDLNQDHSRRGLIIPLKDIWRPIDVIPKFGEACPEEWTSLNSVELADEFYVNSFADKQTFQAVY